MMASTEQHYSLRWNDHTVKIVTAFQSLRDEEDFVDVTIACDGHHYSAHKMVLSACSPYFRSLLRANPCQHPIVILKDVGYLEMERLLEFMYNGEVNIAQDQLAAFLKTAESLKIRGLAGSSDDTESQTQKDISHSYASCLSGSVVGGTSPSVAFSNLTECKDDMLTSESVFVHHTDSPFAKRRKRDNCLSSQVDSSGQISVDGSLLEAPNERDPSNTTIEMNDRREMKAEPTEGLPDVYADSEMVNSEGMDQRSMVYPMGTMPGPSVSSGQETLALNNQDNGDVSALMAIANAVQATAMSDRPIKCPLCQSIIKQARNLRRHVFKRHLPAAQRGEITEADVKNVLERKLKTITVTPLTDDELRQVQQRTRRKGMTRPRKVKGVAALPSDVNTAAINENEITIRKLPQKKNKDKHLFASILPPVDSSSQHEDILQEALAARDKDAEPEDEVMNLTASQHLPPISVVSQVAQACVPCVTPQPVALTISQTTPLVHTRIQDSILSQGVRLHSESPLALHRELTTMPSMTFDPQVSISDSMASYHSSPTQTIPQSTSPSSSVSGYLPGSYWSTSGMSSLPTASFQPHQAVFAPAHPEYFSAGVHMVRPATLDRMSQHRRKPY